MSDIDLTAVYAFGEEGLHCPKCGSRAIYDSEAAEASPDNFEATCPRSLCSVDTFRAAYADPQCGECREFLDDPTAEDDSLCPTCETKD